ncbi:MAG: PilZ domain-containing protein [Pseudomonadota bacterium]
MSEKDQRQHPRRTPASLTFVAIRPDFSHFGKVIDISGGGLRFQFMGMPSSLDDRRSMALDLFVHGNGYYLSEVPCELVHETEVGFVSPSAIATRHFGLRFKDLTRSQAERVEYFIQHYTAE